MCKVYEFPKQLELPKEEAELLELLGEGYVKAMFTSMVKLVDDSVSEREVIKLVDIAFTQGMMKGITDLEEKS